MSEPSGTPISSLSQLRSQLTQDQGGDGIGPSPAQVGANAAPQARSLNDLFGFTDGAGPSTPNAHDGAPDGAPTFQASATLPRSTAEQQTERQDLIRSSIIDSETGQSFPVEDRVVRFGDMPQAEKKAAFASTLGRSEALDVLNDNIFLSSVAALSSGVLDSFPVKLAAQAIDSITSPAELIAEDLVGRPGGAQEFLSELRLKLDEVVQKGTVADVSEWIGRELPFLIATGGFMTFGRAATLWAAPRLSVRAAKFLEATAAARESGRLFGPLTVGERLFHTTGHSLGFSAAELARAGVDGKDFDEAIKDAAIAGALGFGVEAGAFIGLKALSPRFRAKNLDKLTQNLSSKDKQVGIQTILSRGQKQLAELQESGYSRFDQEMMDVFSKVTPEERSSIFIDMIDKANARRLSQGPLTELKEKSSLNVSKANILERDIIQLKQDLIALEKGTRIDPLIGRIISDTPLNTEARIAELELASASTQSRITGVPIPELNAEAMKDLPFLKITHARLVSAPNRIRARGLRIYQKFLQDQRFKFLTSPDGFARRMGISGLKFLSLIEETDTAIAAGKFEIRRRLTLISAQLVEEMQAAGHGLSKKLDKFGHKLLTREQLTNHAFLRDVGHVYEKAPHGRGIEAVAQEFGEGVAGTFDIMVKEMEKLTDVLHEAGVVVKLTEADLAKLGVGNYLPHILHDEIVKAGGREAMIKAMMDRNGISRLQAEDLITTQGFTSDGLRRFGNLDLQRKLRGSTKEINEEFGSTFRQKTGSLFAKKETLFEDDPIRAVQRYMEQAHIRIENGQRFGYRGEVGKLFSDIMVNEGAGQQEAELLVNSVLFERVANGSRDALYNHVTNIQVASKMTFGAIPNSFQTVNAVTTFGMRASYKGFVRFMKQEERDAVLRGLGFMERSIQSSANAYAGREAITLTDKIAEFALDKSLFSITEQNNRVLSAMIAQEYVSLTMKKALEGRLRGFSRQAARRGFAQLGLNFETMVGRSATSKVARIEASELRTLWRNGVRRTQFASSAADLPIMWRTPWGRMVTQFKSFTFNQTRFLTDQVFVEASAGNYKPLAYFMSLYPAIGEVVGDLGALAKGRERDSTGLYRVVENFSYLGGLGLAYNAANAAFFNRPIEFFGGPTAADAMGFMAVVGSTAQGGLETGTESFLDLLASQPVSRAIGGVGLLSDKVAASAIDFGMDIIAERRDQAKRAEVTRRFEDLRLEQLQGKANEGNRR